MNYPIEGTNLHTTATDCSERVHWKGNTACGCEDEFDRIELRPRYSNYPTLDFEMPRQKYELEKVERLMQTSYNRGKTDRGFEIKKMLRDLIGLN